MASTVLQHQNKQEQTVDNYLALAPSFGEALALNANDDEPGTIRQQLVALNGTLKEVGVMASYSQGQFFQGQEATEKIFKEFASSFSIIHLATHAIVDDQNPMNSRLIFTQNDDSVEDGNLYTWELYNLNLNAKMAVLSACNTGFGKLRCFTDSCPRGTPKTPPCNWPK